jgi:phosphate starvation-inducible PhoH-like protein
MAHSRAKQRYNDRQKRKRKIPSKESQSQRIQDQPSRPIKVFSPLVPLNSRQQDYMLALQNYDQVLVKGPPGSAKTYIAARTALQFFKAGLVDRIIIGRATVTKKKHDLGAKPGTGEQKIENWMIPFFDAFKDEITDAELKQLRKEGLIELAPFENMRGRTFRNAFIILTEAASCDYDDLRLFLTRTGEGSRVVIEGDLKQKDIDNSGYATILKMVARHRISAKIIAFEEEHVVRDRRVKEWVIAFNKEDDREETAMTRLYQAPTPVAPLLIPTLVNERPAAELSASRKWNYWPRLFLGSAWSVLKSEA